MRGFTNAENSPVPGVTPSTPLVDGGFCPKGMWNSNFCRRYVVKINKFERARVCPIH